MCALVLVKRFVVVCVCVCVAAVQRFHICGHVMHSGWLFWKRQTFEKPKGDTKNVLTGSARPVGEKKMHVFISASKDNTAKLLDERPVNSAAISPIMDHVVMGGGQEAMEVTTTSTRIDKFEARFFYAV
ncbi:eukaryotic translation initiation factor 3 subunit I isoform X2 [Cynoglossus semilaevis]|uniref:eukaryotic translation initiation factor 3 subunit I isoform X2 n=1 Tax=Cynoglossus semilaevis TaxID=244447 RepID=UPI000D62CC8D|nr:eukaryotic translation initiation factor 3 subunit I-like isoform X2 [Cynoglossus semilaevis]